VEILIDGVGGSPVPDLPAAHLGGGRW
jgi:hypothetical protein